MPQGIIYQSAFGSIGEIKGNLQKLKKSIKLKLLNLTTAIFIKNALNIKKTTCIRINTPCLIRN